MVCVSWNHSNKTQDHADTSNTGSFHSIQLPGTASTFIIFVQGCDRSSGSLQATRAAIAAPSTTLLEAPLRSPVRRGSPVTVVSVESELQGRGGGAVWRASARCSRVNRHLAQAFGGSWHTRKQWGTERGTPTKSRPLKSSCQKD